MTKELLDLNLSQARDALRSGKVSAPELTEAYIKAIEAHDDRLNCYITRSFDHARTQAKEAAVRLGKEKDKAPDLCGIPLGIKDLFITKGIRTTAASKILGDFIPPYESTITQKLWNDGAVCLGKLNMDEFAMGSANLSSAFGPVENPWKRKGSDEKLVPGGSSGGSSAAVAAGLALGALGSDTGGSIRQPASFTGIVGVKPTYGTCSRFGMVSYCSSMDQAGPMTRNLRDSAILLEGMAGHGIDRRDSTLSTHKVPNFEASIGKSVKGMRIGIPKEFCSEKVSDEISAIWNQGIEWLKAAGAEIKEVSLPTARHSLAVYYILAVAEASTNLSRYDGVRFGIRVKGKTLDEMYEATREAGFGAEVKRRIVLGTYVLSSGKYDDYFVRAQKVRRKITEDFNSVFNEVDAILTPTAPTGAFAWDHKDTNPVNMYLNDMFTVPVNLAGLPAMSVPAGLDHHGVPLGLQLIGKAFSEETLFSLGNVLEENANFNQRPALWAGN